MLNFIHIVVFALFVVSHWFGGAIQAQSQDSKTPPPVEVYMGRRIAQTMHFGGAEWLIRDEREREERCSLMLTNLGIKPGQVICDMGCGNGFYTLQLAKMLGDHGTVIGVDVQPEMLSMLRDRMEQQGVENIIPILGSYHSPRLPANTVDRVLMVDVYHEFSHPESMLAGIRKSLKPDGQIVLVEYREEDPSVPIKPLHKMSKQQIDKEMQANGFKLVSQFEHLPWQHMMFYGIDDQWQGHAVEPEPAYDPMAVNEEGIDQTTFTVEDKTRSRDIPIRVYLPADTRPAPVILFSHGLGGSRDNNPYLGRHWSARGYVAVFMQHPGSDEDVWRGVRLGQRLAEMRKAASAENFQLRVKDVPAVIDQLERWNQEAHHELGQRMDLTRIGMCGHSFGAVTTQAVSGQTFLGQQAFTDARIQAALAMSPSKSKTLTPERSFGNVSIPWLLMSGTNDTSVINDTTVEDRLAVYPALPTGHKYELVLDEAEHSAFNERGLPGDRDRRNPNHHRAILAISTAFWDTYLKEEKPAREWLDSDTVRQVLEPQDRWQRK